MFCQTCGVQQIAVGDNIPFPTAKQCRFDIQTIDKRIYDVQSAKISSKYGRQKSQLEAELQTFLGKLNTPKTPFSCAPRYLVRFLVWKDQKGRTKVHKHDCKFLGSSVKGQCDCPSRLSAGTVDSTISKLRSIFNNLDGSGDYDMRSRGSNPAAHFSVMQYLKSIQTGQAEARISPTQATFLFFNNVHRIVLHLRHFFPTPSRRP